MRAEHVFTPNAFPDITFIDTHLVDRTKQLTRALAMGSGVISLSGPSKSGKTVFIEKNIGNANLIQITGAGIDSVEKFWERVFAKIGTPIPQSTTESTGTQQADSKKAALGVPMTAGAELNSTATTTTSIAGTAAASFDSLQLGIEELSNSGIAVFIDDFHYIQYEVQKELSNQIKEAVRNNIVFVVAAVPYHSDDTVRANPDLRGRIVNIDFDYWEPGVLEEIARKGFHALGVQASPALVSALAAEAAGSPQLMQLLCLHCCWHHDIEEAQATLVTIDADMNAISAICKSVGAHTDYSSLVNQMQDGPKKHGQNRTVHLLQDGTQCDIYPLILKAIALDPPTLTIRYADIQNRVAKLCASAPPSGSSIISACQHITRIANSGTASIMEWDSGADVLDIRDPYLLFYLRWSQ